ncbi:MAG: OmpA family protein [Alphaproteobacteria bacterium]|nr:OmpA family protein [Alphaproteobacteria bacterium]
MNLTAGLKKIGAASVLALAAACASSSGPDVVANAPDQSAQTDRGYAKGSQEDLERNAGHRVFFGYNEYSLTPDARVTLARQAEWLKANPSATILVSGNCDERGTREYNLALGARRAQAARSFLISNGVDAARITTKSNGKERPLDSRSTEEAWKLNRNATTTLTGVPGA